MLVDEQVPAPPYIDNYRLPSEIIHVGHRAFVTAWPEDDVCTYIYIYIYLFIIYNIYTIHIY